MKTTMRFSLKMRIRDGKVNEESKTHYAFGTERGVFITIKSADGTIIELGKSAAALLLKDMDAFGDDCTEPGKIIREQLRIAIKRANRKSQIVNAK